MLYKILGALIIIAAATLAFLTLREEPQLALTKKKTNSKVESACVQLTPAEQLVKLIDDDFKQLQAEQQLPAQWASIATIEYRIGSELARALLGKAKPGIQRVQNGSSYLEIELMDLPDEVNPGIILQASLFDIKTKNKIFEIGRTYTMNDLNHQIPPEQPKEKAKGTQQEVPSNSRANTPPSPSRMTEGGNSTEAPHSMQNNQPSSPGAN